MSDYYRLPFDLDVDDVNPPRRECPYRTGTALEDMCQLDNCICSYRGRECEKGLAAEEKEKDEELDMMREELVRTSLFVATTEGME